MLRWNIDEGRVHIDDDPQSPDTQSSIYWWQSGRGEREKLDSAVARRGGGKSLSALLVNEPISTVFSNEVLPSNLAPIYSLHITPWIYNIASSLPRRWFISRFTALCPENIDTHSSILYEDLNFSFGFKCNLQNLFYFIEFLVEFRADIH